MSADGERIGEGHGVPTELGEAHVAHDVDQACAHVGGALGHARRSHATGTVHGHLDSHADAFARVVALADPPSITPDGSTDLSLRERLGQVRSFGLGLGLGLGLRLRVAPRCRAAFVVVVASIANPIQRVVDPVTALTVG